MSKTFMLYNTRGRKKEEFTPLFDDYIGIYTCGPTVYDYQHIGNMRAAIFHDLLKRTLQYSGYTVKHVTNITDVGHLTQDDRDQGEDKLVVGAKREKKSVWDIAKYYTDIYKQDRLRLNVLEPTIWCNATDYIQEQIVLIQELEKKGYTYIIEDGVYFDTSKFADYGKWALLDIHGIEPGIRIDASSKRNATDFALWKFSPTEEKREMQWESPWGIGFPGWHIECSAMAIAHLNHHFDIHCGGIEHIPIHHTNEIAQSECALNESFFRYWMHNEHLILEGGVKMSKSLGNVVLLRDILEQGFHPLSFRYLCLNTHYRKPISFSFRILSGAQQSLYSLIHLIDITLIHPRAKQQENVQTAQEWEMIFEQAKTAFDEAMLDDLETPNALASLFTFLKALRQLDTLPSKSVLKEIIDWIYHIDAMVLGLSLQELLEELHQIPEDIHQLAKERDLCRQEKNYAKADEIRLHIQQKGYTLMDTEFGTMIQKQFTESIK